MFKSIESFGLQSICLEIKFILLFLKYSYSFRTKPVSSKYELAFCFLSYKTTGKIRFPKKFSRNSTLKQLVPSQILI